MSEDSLIYESAKAAVLGGLKDDPEAHLHVGAIVLQLVQAELKKPQATTKPVLTNVSHGTMAGLLLLGKDLRVGAVEIVKAVTQIIQERSGDPGRTMGYALEGIARIGTAVTPDQLSDIGDSLEREIMGTGREFEAFAEKYRKSA